MLLAAGGARLTLAKRPMPGCRNRSLVLPAGVAHLTMILESDENPERIIIIPDPISVEDLASALGLRWFEVIRTLMRFNVFATMRTKVRFSLAAKVCSRHGVTARKGD
jgi:hypothetical protein